MLIYPFHYGKAPPWLFERMARLAGDVSQIIIEDFGQEVFLEKLSDPFWFQAFGCVLGFDWHSSGLTTTVCGALKEAIKLRESELGIFVAGGKGAISRKTPQEIENVSQKFSFASEPLIYASRMSAKVDNTGLQDGYQLYHHNIFFDKKGNWSVIQQGMNTNSRMARRYHWLSSKFDSFIQDPHTAICSNKKHIVLNFVTKESRQVQDACVLLVTDNLRTTLKEIKKLNTLDLPRRHPIYSSDFDLKRLEKTLRFASETNPKDFEALLGTKNIGPKTMRALSLVSELIYGSKPSFKDPARFSFAHGGKDGYPFPVDKKTYDKSIQILSHSVSKSPIDKIEKRRALATLAKLEQLTL